MPERTRVIVTGSRHLVSENRHLVWDRLDVAYHQHGPLTVVHGHCETGADRFADQWVTDRAAYGWDVQAERHPADWAGPCQPGFCPPRPHRKRRGRSTYCPLAGHRRNQDMVDLGAAELLAFPQNGAANKGTTDCRARGERAGILVGKVACA